MDDNDLDEYSLGLEEQYEFSLGESSFDFSNNTYIPSKDKISVEEFYEKYIKNWSMKEDYDDYIIQNVNPADFYKVLSLEPFAIPTNEDIERIKVWKDEWCNESESLDKEKINGSTKEEIIKNALSCLAVKLTMDNQCKAFTEKYKTSTWKEIRIIIREKTLDGKVTIFELEQIYQVANSKGLFCTSLIEESKKTINTIIKEEGAKVISVEDSLKEYSDIQIKKSQFNSLNTEKNVNRLFSFYYMLYQKDYYLKTGLKDQNEKMLRDNFASILKQCNIKLLDKIETFKKCVFSVFLSNHNINEPITQDDLLSLHADAIKYGLSQSEWDNFIQAQGITTAQDVNEIEDEKNYTPNEYNFKEEPIIQNISKTTKKKSKGFGIGVTIAAVLALFGLCAGIFSNIMPFISTPIISNDKDTVSETTSVQINDENKENETGPSIEDKCIESTKQCIYRNMSKTEMYEELRSTGSFSDKEISNAIKNINPSFKNAAKVKAELYIKKGNFSKNYIYNSLINTNKFTQEEAQYAIENANINWEEIAITKAQSLFNEGLKTRVSLITSLENDYNFDEDEAYQAINLINVNWTKLASANARELFAQFGNKDDIYKNLIEQGFTSTEASNALHDIDKYLEVLEKAQYRINKKYEGRELVATNLIKYNGCNYDDVEFVLDSIDWKKVAAEQVAKLKQKKKSDDYIIKYLVNNKKFTQEEVYFGLQNYKGL